MKTRIIDPLCVNLPGCAGGDVTCCQCDHQVTSGIRLIVEEQCRQEKQEEGWTLEDDNHSDGKLALVAACYAEFAILSSTERVEQTLAKDRYWPWDEGWWKPKNPLHDLVHAGALIAAEIDRLLKAEPQLIE